VSNTSVRGHAGVLLLVGYPRSGQQRIQRAHRQCTVTTTVVSLHALEVALKVRALIVVLTATPCEEVVSNRRAARRVGYFVLMVRPRSPSPPRRAVPDEVSSPSTHAFFTRALLPTSGS